MSWSTLSHLSRWNVVLLVLATSGCTTFKTTNTARSSTEQLLISNAVDQSLNKIDFQPFANHAVFLDEKYVDCVDKAYVLASIRHRLLHVGARLVDKIEDSEVALQPSVGTLGTSDVNSFIGVPEITLPGMLTLPEIRLVTRTRQVGVAKIGLVALDPKTRTALGEGGIVLAKSDDTNTSVLGIGPFQSGTIREEVERSTTGTAGYARVRMPVQVAFQQPAAERIPEAPAAAKQVEYTSLDAAPEGDTAPAGEATPASSEQTDAPGWSKP